MFYAALLALGIVHGYPLVAVIASLVPTSMLFLLILPANELVRTLNFCLQTTILIFLTAGLLSLLALIGPSEIGREICEQNIEDDVFSGMNDCTGYLYTYLRLIWLLGSFALIGIQLAVVMAT